MKLLGSVSKKKRVKMAFSGMECNDLTDDAIKILGIYFSYNKN